LTNYDGFDQDRIYRWGYLTVRFMFESYPSEVNQMLVHTRAGGWDAYQEKLNNGLLTIVMILSRGLKP